MFTQKITPNPNISCKPGWCLEYVRRAFGQNYVVNPTATAAWNTSKTQHRDRNFPAGVAVPVYYGLAREPAGHIVIRMPDGSVYSTSDNSNVPHHHPSIADLEAYYKAWGWPLTYRGWTEDVQGTAVITPSTISVEGTVKKKDGFEMAEVKDVVEALLSAPVKKGDGTGEITLKQLLAWYDPNRKADLDEIFNRKIVRGGGQTGETSLQSTLAWQDANLSALKAKIDAQDATIKALAGAVAAVSGGAPFDQAKLLASIQTAVKSALPTTVSFK